MIDFLANKYLFKVNNRHTKRRCEICPKLTINDVNVFLLISNKFLTFFRVFLLLTLNSKLFAGYKVKQWSISQQNLD